ncbi:MAG TPA: hypothetical protein VLT45_11235 [Kofleriaceae bacterium]|nr:hypothetical protein [Kofleriaceae bacterium]
MSVSSNQKGYKRSWKNLLLNKRYQLRFTLFMVGISALLMTGLGIWVMKQANEATTVAIDRVRGDACPKIPELTDIPADADNGVPLKLPDGDGSAEVGSAAPAPVPSSVDPKDVAKHNAQADLLAVKALWCTTAECSPASAEPLQIRVKDCDAYVKGKLEDADAVAALRKATIPVVKCDGGQAFTVADAPEPRHVTVVMDESSMTMTPAVPGDYADRVVAHWTCEIRQAGSIDELQRGRIRILGVLIATGLLLMFGLAIYGIKMTHKVAGPLFKVSLYLAKMRDGRYDKVWNLRKGDQLVDFYEHFKTAHAGVVALEKEDIETIKAVIAAAEAAGAGESVGELRTILARKEKSIE